MRPTLSLRILAVAAMLFGGGCATVASRRDATLAPVPIEEENEPLACKVVRVIPGTPAERAGISPGDEIRQIGTTRFAGVRRFTEVLSRAPGSVPIVVYRDGREREMEIALDEKPPRLGVVCDMVGVQDIAVDFEGRHFVHESRRGFTVFAGAEIIRGLVFVRLGVQNRTAGPIEIDPANVSASDNGGVALARLTPVQAMSALHGDDAATVMQSQAATATAATVASPAADLGIPDLLESAALTAWAMGPLVAAQGRESARADARYILSNSLLPCEVVSGFSIAGVVYFAEPAAYPFKIRAGIGGENFEFHFEEQTR